MATASKWEVVWSRNEPILVYRTEDGIFKVFKLKVEQQVLLTEPIQGNAEQRYNEFKKRVCEELDLDGSACDQVRALYNELFGLTDNVNVNGGEE